MTIRSIATSIVLAATLLIASRSASADDTHYQDFVVGGRAMGLGGAFTAIADDPSGLFYNPAGIADVRNTSLQVSTSLYGFERGTIGDRLAVPVPGVENLDLDFTELIVIPASAGFVTNLGDTLPNGMSRHSYGVSVMVPSYRSFAALQSDGSATYRRRVTDRELWVGTGYGRRLTPRLSIGASIYYVLRTVSDTEEVTSNESLPGGAQRFQVVSNDITIVTGNIIALLGAKLRLSPGWTLGVSVRLPNLPVHSDADLLFSRAASDPSAAEPVSLFNRRTLSDGKARTNYAPMARVGLSFTEKYRYTLSADLSAYMPVQYALITVDDPALVERLPFSPDIQRNAVVNLNFGAEYLLIRSVSVGLGVFTDFSTADEVPSLPEADQQPHLDLYGLTLALGYFGEYTLSRLGVSFSFGTGEDVIPQSDIARLVENEQAFREVEYTQTFFYVFVSNTFRY